MPNSPDFLNRMHRVLESRVEQKKEAETPRFQRLRQGFAAVLGALAVFFVLKGAAMAVGVPLNTRVPAEAGFAAALQHWVVGPDPVSSTLALALQGGIRHL
jgi:hypothetical protein